MKGALVPFVYPCHTHSYLERMRGLAAGPFHDISLHLYPNNTPTQTSTSLTFVILKTGTACLPYADPSVYCSACKDPTGGKGGGSGSSEFNGGSEGGGGWCSLKPPDPVVFAPLTRPPDIGTRQSPINFTMTQTQY